ncbi:MAG: hypothetical protein ACR2NP_20055 [Pirellulaceae bacterium]
MSGKANMPAAGLAWVTVLLLLFGNSSSLTAQQSDDGYIDEPAEESLVNTNRLMHRHSAGLTYASSTAWTGYAIEHLFDGDQLTSWFSAKNDIASDDSQPWVEVTFPVGVSVVHVNVWGNREPSWSTGYSVTRGRLELYDENGNLLQSVEAEAEGDQYDFEFGLDKPVEQVRRVRFVSIADQGTTNGDRCIALGEIEIE